MKLPKILNERPLESGLVLGLVVGILIGWLAIGWGIWPLEWKDANAALLRDDFKQDYVKMTASLYSYTLDKDAAIERMREWPDAEIYVCQMANNAADGIEEQNLINLVKAIAPGYSCTEEKTEAADEEQGGNNLIGQILMLCGIAVVALGLVAGVFFFLSRQQKTPALSTRLDLEDEKEPPTPPTATTVAAPSRTIPLAQFPTEFNIGHDTYDDSFSIETATGEFLGECGVGISESIGVDEPKKVTAFEVWLFDKNDIRTVTKVIMSDHAYHDDALRAKLAPKGEAVLAIQDETIVLETASLIINARIVEMEYGSDETAPDSFFERLVVELAAWAKEAGELPDTNDSVEEDDPDDTEFSL
ncbi:MAG: hypothetical protein JXA42_12650 [Anaerolineales bacterium]|nr:hypothetical protein [Anaerolineales bacterium]